MPGKAMHKGKNIRSNFGLHANDMVAGSGGKSAGLDNDIIKSLAQLVIERLDKLEQEAVFHKLEKLPAGAVGNEATIIRNEIRTLKRRLTQLQEKTSF